jgi:hypothetical protein
MEAMAAGVPVILPPNFRETFQDGAIYAEPAEVYSVIQRLWMDKAAYDAQVERGLEYVNRTCSLTRFEDRVRPFIFEQTAAKQDLLELKRRQAGISQSLV